MGSDTSGKRGNQKLKAYLIMQFIPFALSPCSQGKPSV